MCIVCVLTWSLLGLKKIAWAAPRSVSLRGLIQNFRRTSPPLSYAESPPSGVRRSKTPLLKLRNDSYTCRACAPVLNNHVTRRPCWWTKHYTFFSFFAECAFLKSFVARVGLSTIWGSLSSDVFERRPSAESGLLNFWAVTEQIFGQIVSLSVKTLGNRRIFADVMVYIFPH